MGFLDCSARLARRALSCLLAIVLAVGLAPAAPAHADEPAAGEAAQARAWMGFPDVQEGEWYATADVLGYAVENGLLAGYGNGRFGPYDEVTRAQVATVLWRVAGEPAADAEDFSDVDYSQWYGAAVEWARSTGVVSGYGETNAFGPEGPVTREQLAVMLSNYAGKVAGLDASSDCAALDAVAGAEQVSSWAREAMGWAVDEGILSGVEVDGVAWVDPQGTAQRCQVAKMASVFHRDVLGLGGQDVPDPDVPAVSFNYEIADWIEHAEPRSYPVDPEAERLYGCRLDDGRDGIGNVDDWGPKHGLGGQGVGVYAPSSYDCGHGAYVFGFEGDVEDVVIPNELGGEPVVFAAVGLDAGQRLDLSEAKSLKAVVVWGYAAGGLDFGEGTNLENVFVEWPLGPFLDMSGQTGINDLLFNLTDAGFQVGDESLQNFSAFYSSLGALDFTGAVALERLYVFGAPLESLALGNCPSLKYLFCEESYLTALDISGCPNLTELYCAGNYIADMSALEAWFAQPGHSGRISPQLGVM